MQINNALQKLINQLPDAVLDEMRPVWGNSQVGSIKAAILEGRKALDETTEESVNDALLQSLKAYRSAQRRILEKWSEGDHHVKADLWRDLHHCEDAATAAIEVAENWKILEANELIRKGNTETHDHVSISDPRIHQFVSASQFAMRLLSQNADDAVAQACIAELAKAISNVTVYGKGPMIQERPYSNIDEAEAAAAQKYLSREAFEKLLDSLSTAYEPTAAQSDLLEEQVKNAQLKSEVRRLNSFLRKKRLSDEFEQWLVDEGEKPPRLPGPYNPYPLNPADLDDF